MTHSLPKKPKVLKKPLTPIQKHATKRSLAALVLFGVTASIFMGLAKEVRDSETLTVDTSILNAIHHYTGGMFDQLVVYITNTSGPIIIPIVTALLCVVLLYTEKRNYALKLMLGVGGASLIGVILKNIFNRQRPDLWDKIVTEHTFSFPSGHAIASSALAASIIFALWHTKWRYPSIILGVLYSIIIAFTRLYLGVHYPSDIIAGWCISLSWVALVWFIFTQTKKEVTAKADPSHAQTQKSS